MKKQQLWTRIFSSAALLLTMVLMTSTATAASRIFNLHLVNGFNQPVFFVIGTGWHNCYEGQPGLGSMMGPVNPGQRVTIKVARVQGHGCDGKQGKFEVMPSVAGGAPQRFDFSNNGYINLTNLPGGYNVSLSPKSPRDESYTWTISP